MQKIVRSNMSASRNINQDNAKNEPPAFLLAQRIKTEQGTQRAAEFLCAMEPFLAPAERMHISSRLSLPNIENEHREQANVQGMGGFSMPNMSNMGGGMGNPMQLLGMLSAMNQAPKNGGGAMDTAMLAQLMSLMNKK